MKGDPIGKPKILSKASVNNEVVRYVDALNQSFTSQLLAEKLAREEQDRKINALIAANQAAQALINADVEARLTDGNENL